MNISNSFNLGNDFILLAFEDAFTGAKDLLSHEEFHQYEIVFRGDMLKLFENAESFALKTENSMYKDYYYNSWGYPIAGRSLQSAIWVIEDNCGFSNKFNYFIVLKKTENFTLPMQC